MFSKNIRFDDPSKNQRAEKKLFKLRQKLIGDDPVIHTGPFLEKLQKLKDSPVYDCLTKMPKPCVQHMHDRAAVSAKWMVENLCYYENVYFNEK